MTSTQPPGWFTGRTRLITIVSIVAVGLAGATAVSANIGILDAASDSDVGTVSAAGDLITTTAPPTQVIDVYLPGESTSTTATSATTPATAAPAPAAPTGVQEFTVDVAGAVAVATTDTGLRLERVSPAPGWSWTLAQTSPTQLMVTMTNGVRTLEFMAAASADGTIAANVNEPIVIPAPAPSVTTGSSGGGSYDDDENEHEGGDDHEDDDDGDDEYEGGEDDD